jgi:NADP-dependent 3-hydroxy acid dehydrogenase YdfG
MSKPVLILGAASGMARAIARSFAAEGHAIQLAARNVDRLEADRDDLVTRYGVRSRCTNSTRSTSTGTRVSSRACPTCRASPSAPWAPWARRRRTRKTP